MRTQGYTAVTTALITREPPGPVGGWLCDRAPSRPTAAAGRGSFDGTANEELRQAPQSFTALIMEGNIFGMETP